MLKPSELKATEFDMSVLGGYKRENVDAFFNSVVNDYEKLYNENAELVDKLKSCVEKIEEYQKDEKFLRAAIINAEKLNENSLKEIERREKEIEQVANDQANSIIEKAKIEAENIVNAAKYKAAEEIRIREIDAAEKIATINANIAIENEKLINLKKEISDFKESILKLYKDHLNSLSKLPEFSHNTEKTSEVVTKTAPVTVSKEQMIQDAEIEQTESKKIEAEQQVISDAEQTTMASVIHDSQTEKTAEFVIDKKNAQNESSDTFEKNFKFQGLKFGADFDVKKDK